MAAPAEPGWAAGAVPAAGHAGAENSFFVRQPVAFLNIDAIDWAACAPRGGPRAALHVDSIHLARSPPAAFEMFNMRDRAVQALPHHRFALPLIRFIYKIHSEDRYLYF